MDNDQLYLKLTGIFYDVFDDDSIVLRPDMTANDVEGWDSLSHIRLLLTVERTFKVKFSAAEVNKLNNVAELVDMIGAKLR